MSSVLSSFNRSRPTSPIKPPSPLKAPSKSSSSSSSQHPRQSSGVYSTFSTKQIQGFKEAFNMLDEDSNGIVSREDLKANLRNLGGEDSDAVVKRYFDTAVGGQNAAGINFTQFLTMFGEHLNEMDEAPTLREAFECFDEKDDGVIDAAELRHWLSSVGDRMTDDEIDRLLSGPFTDRGGKNFDYRAFVEAVKMSEPAELE